MVDFYPRFVSVSISEGLSGGGTALGENITPAVPPSPIPEITWITTPGTSRAKNDSIVFSIADDALAYAVVYVTFVHMGVDEVAYRSTRGFTSRYSGSSAEVSVTEDLTETRFTLRRRGGWPDDLRISIDAVDVRGQIG